MNENYHTQRLNLKLVNLADAEFIRVLVNTPEWIQFIGNRNIKSIADAESYIQKMIDGENLLIWVVRLNDSQTPIGMISFIKRNYLEHYDIGFGFLNDYKKQGYAFEASKVVLNDAISNGDHSQILATTIKDNVNSILLLERLGLQFQTKIENEGEELLVYGNDIGKIISNRVKLN
jgi:[ribosomal protein S5]-alanine N-acetyltransferase